MKGTRYIEVTLQFGREDEFISALCPELGTSAFGATNEEAFEAITEAVVLQLETLDDAGDLESFLDRNGVTLVTAESLRWVPVNPRLVSA